MTEEPFPPVRTPLSQAVQLLSSATAPATFAAAILLFHGVAVLVGDATAPAGFGATRLGEEAYGVGLLGLAVAPYVASWGTFRRRRAAGADRPLAVRRAAVTMALWGLAALAVAVAVSL